MVRQNCRKPLPPTCSAERRLLWPDPHATATRRALESLTRRIDEHGLPQSAFGWYKDLRRYGTVPHSGFGIGVERTLSWIAGLEHVRESAAFARMLYRLTP